MKVYFLTLGCRVNQYETDAVRADFIAAGHEITERPEDADCLIVNTCSVTGEADRKSRQMLRRMARANPDAIVVAMGCASELADGVVDADIVLGTRDKNLCLSKVEEYAGSRDHKTSHVRPPVSRTDSYHDFGTVLSPEGTRAFLKVEDGCNKFCTYCVIPFARGRVASRTEESAIEEARFLAGEGYKEIVVSGIHVCSYAKDRGGDIMDLLELLKKIAEIPGIVRLRLGSVEPMSLTYEFLKGLSETGVACPHFHMSLQSGSDTVLKRMNRDYTSAEFEEKVRMVRELFPDVSITTDIICGFPGETDEEFSETLAFARKIGLAKIHCFPYSVREGTVAAGMPGQIAPEVKKARNLKLIALSSELEKAFAGSFIGKQVEVLVEQDNAGYTASYVRAKIESEDRIEPGTLVSGTVVRIKDGELIVK